MDDRRRAIKILTNTYWSPRGWKSAGNLHWQPATPPEDLAFAISQGVMFPTLVTSHDNVIRSIVASMRQLAPTTIGAAFVSSLTSHRLDLRSVLATYAVARHMPVHAFKPGGHPTRCAVCGGSDGRDPIDVNVLNFERHKWGGVRHDDPLYISLDLEWFAREPAPAPTSADIAMLQHVLKSASSLEPAAKLTDLVKALAPIVPGNTDERRALIGILGYAGVLQPRERPGYVDGFVLPNHRTETPHHKDDWPYPVRWWRGRDGDNAAAVRLWFEGLS